jgi:very-short-patch-repair endonuclease
MTSGSSLDRDLRIARMASEQYGAVSRAQLRQAGVSDRAVDHRLAKGSLIGLHTGVYRLAACPATPYQRIVAATLAAGPGAVASHRAAAFLHGLAGVEPVAEVTVARSRAPRPTGVVVHRLHLRGSDVEVRNGIPRTRPPATIVGLAAVVPVPVLEAAVDDALLRGLVSCAQLERRLAAGGTQGRPGAAALGALLDVRRGRRWTQSEFERRLLGLVRQAGLPQPVPQFEVTLPDRRRAFLDFAWPELRVAVEADSYRHHASRRDWARDHTRNNVLTSLGWRILPVTWDDMVERPGQLVDLLQRARAA